MASCAAPLKPNVGQRVVDRHSAQHTTILIEASKSRPRTWDLQAIASADRRGSQVRDAILFECSRENFRWRSLLTARSGRARLSGLTVLRCAILRDPPNSTIRYLLEMAAWRRDFASIQIGCARRSTNGSTLVEWGRESECRFKSGKTVRNVSNDSSVGREEPNRILRMTGALQRSSPNSFGSSRQLGREAVKRVSRPRILTLQPGSAAG